jgi:hypothetical protein
LDLADCDQITDTGLRTLRAATELKRLDLKFCDHVTDEGVSALSQVAHVFTLCCFGVKNDMTEQLGYQEVVMTPDPQCQPSDKGATDFVFRALLDFEPRDRLTRRCFFVDLGYHNRVVLSGDRRASEVTLDIPPAKVNWAHIAWRFSRAVPRVHKRWVFFSGLYKSIRVHARPLH